MAESFTAQNDRKSRAGTLPLIGSELAFDLTNTSSGRGYESHIEYLLGATDVVLWARHTKILTSADAEWGQAAVISDALLGEMLVVRTRALRETIYNISKNLAAGTENAARDIGDLADMHSTCIARARLIKHDKGFVWSWSPQEALVESILGPITLSAITLLTQSDLSRIKQCQGNHCGWLFFDTTKNKSRRWCEMEVCGNRAKQKRHVTRHKGGS